VKEIWVPQPEDYKGPWYGDPHKRLGILLIVLILAIGYSFRGCVE